MESLKKNKEFKKVYENGSSYATRNLVIYCLNYEKGKKNRYGLSVSKKIGNAVVRNRLKRRLREIIREFEREKEFKGYDIIFIARKPVVNLDYHRLKKDVKKLYQKMNII
ncbi:ribonuclease P protein component [Halanaerobium saccharolyticum]|uniref:Ribonuclease P protein component n=1 Tax=Halanaerobium saccharolyticum TaxID=43595 RepID=A0A2T5RI64_9FIRM|nr:ribonuclease P protein component [Halanaerobium saccharolyticum]PTV97907.1 ribonuclease P protein component [Halanaerobium saccharolyticum]TDP96011.1 ribonuclease P protein component [Halanaerobium saccharolyticum]